MRLSNSRRRQTHRRLTAINTTSTADMSFILLIFFLVTSSMDTDKGLRHNMPPKEEKKELAATDIDRKDVFSVSITKENTFLLNDTLCSEREIMTRMKSFVANVRENHVIEVKADKNATYSKYFMLQNIISRIYKTLRDEEAVRRYHKTFSNCNDEQQTIIQKAIPQRVSEEFTDVE